MPTSLQRLRLFLAPVLAAGLAATQVAIAAAHDEPHPVGMQDVSKQVGAATPSRSGAAGATNRAAAPVSSSATASNSQLRREVFGFALASSLADGTVGYPSWNFSLLSTVAFFRLYINDDGTITNDSGLTEWNSSDLTNLVTTAHNAGAKVVVTVDLQDFSPAQTHMCAGLTNRATAVSAIAAQVTAKGVDGVNLDFEGENATCQNGQTTRAMMTALAHDMRAALAPGAYLSVDTYASSAADPAGFFDIPGLNSYADSFFVMAYDLEYSNYAHSPLGCSSFCLGPTAPLTGYYYNDTTTASQYVSAVGAAKVILGVPYYGRKSCVAAPTANAYPTGSSGVTADTYLDATSESSQPQVKAGSYAVHRDSHDPSGQERWDTWFNTTMNCNRELYWDDTTSLGKKYDLVNTDGLRGVGIWNLNYGGGASELWSSLYDHFVSCTSAGVASDLASPQQRGAQVTFNATSSGCAAPLYEFWLQSPNGTWAMKRGFSATPTWTWDTSSYVAGNYTLHVWANQSGGLQSTWQAIAEEKFTLNPSPACATASLSPSPVSQQAGSTIAFTATSTGCPYPRYEYWIRFGTAWYPWRPFSTDPTWNLNTSGFSPGTYVVHVWANQAGDQTAALESVGESVVTLTGCTSASVAPASGTAAVGTPVTFTATSGGCTNVVYEFWLEDTQGYWHLMRGWGANTWTWTNAGWGKGVYHLHVWAMPQGAYGGAFEVFGAATYTLF